MGGHLIRISIASGAAIFLGASCSGGATDPDATVVDASSLPCYGLGWPQYCQAPLALAVRSTEHLAPSREEVRDYYRRLRPAYAEMPVLAFAEPSPGWSPAGAELSVTSAYQPLIDAWSEGDFVSDDPAVASILVDAPLSLSIEGNPSESMPGYWVFVLRAADFEHLSWQVLQSRVSAVPDTQLDGMAVSDNGMDVVHTPEAGRDVFQFSLGWADCPLGCIFQHRWRAIVTNSGAVTIEDLGGDDLSLSGYPEKVTMLPPLPEA